MTTKTITTEIIRRSTFTVRIGTDTTRAMLSAQLALIPENATLDEIEDDVGDLVLVLVYVVDEILTKQE